MTVIPHGFNYYKQTSSGMWLPYVPRVDSLGLNGAAIYDFYRVAEMLKFNPSFLDEGELEKLTKAARESSQGINFDFGIMSFGTKNFYFVRDVRPMNPNQIPFPGKRKRYTHLQISVSVEKEGSSIISGEGIAARKQKYKSN